MNANDLTAARRLIDQFEGKATGRHNSAREMRSRSVVDGKVADPVPDRMLQRLQPSKERCEDCAIGDWVEYIPGIPPTHMERVKYLPPLSPHDHVSLIEDPSIEMMDRHYWEFERFRYCSFYQPSSSFVGWRRIS